MYSRFTLALAVISSISFILSQALDSCPDTSTAQYDYVVVGAGAGGGPLAARLAESGFTGQSTHSLNLVFVLNAPLQSSWSTSATTLTTSTQRSRHTQHV